jgi:prepilin-type N-terminal cleavage/methylation domain-containing protein/prepilin-type processing-associated H-X9-DG protein
MKRKTGFTLIELLVVIAIIAILAAMLFPVFARARESARKIQCLSNVKNIAMAVQMYLTDYDRFPPSEHRTEVNDWFTNLNGGSSCLRNPLMSNPYLRWPVVFEEYIKNRDVWRCPSAGQYHTETTFQVNPCTPDWFTAAKNDPAPTSCTTALNNGGVYFPPGWGGTITDSFVQTGQCAGGSTGGFDQSIGTATCGLIDTKTSQIDDPVRRVVVADAGVHLDFDRTSWIAYPDMCRLDGAGGCGDPTHTCASCTYSFISQCGANDPRYGWDAAYRQQNAHPRHLGGSNIGFADGHAQWMPSEQILFGSDRVYNHATVSNAPLEGIMVCNVFGEQIH